MLSQSCVWKKKDLPFPRYVLYDNVNVSIKGNLIMNECVQVDLDMLITAGNGQLFKVVDCDVIVPFPCEAVLVRMNDLGTLRRVCTDGSVDQANRIAGVVRIVNVPDLPGLVIVAHDRSSAESAQTLLEEARERKAECEKDFIVPSWVSKRLSEQRAHLLKEFAVDLTFEFGSTNSEVHVRGTKSGVEGFESYLSRLIDEWQSVFVDIPEDVFKLWHKNSTKERERLKLRLSDPVDEKVSDQQVKRFFISASSVKKAKEGRQILQDFLKSMFWKTEIKVPSSKVSAIIGRNGSIIHELSHRHGQVKINIRDESVDGMKSVSIKGSHAAVRSVIVDIQNIAHKH
eukprot:TRINITY_DN5790_c0_g1_i1.p1 TRINITY_DN5790_c0_g1~~TRINITY_DN5790_c0_g1_i1.p1  ORF type:complete len:343 (-),score=79.29 TRINITY_DN5790_c0_g1_i1:55-1083(-)